MCGSELQNSESMVDDLSSLGQDLISTMLGEKYDSVRECIETEHGATDRPRKYCSLAQFVEGNDIARRSFKRPARYMNMLGQEVCIFTNTCRFFGDLRKFRGFINFMKRGGTMSK